MTKIGDLAHGRSGDKGNHANIAIIANDDAAYTWLCEHLTPEVVREHFAPFEPSEVVRYEAKNLRALNFLLKDVLGGGASGSLRIDTQAKTFALSLLELSLDDRK